MNTIGAQEYSADEKLAREIAEEIEGHMFVEGRLQRFSDVSTVFDVISPSRGEVFAQMPEATAEMVSNTVNIAGNAQPMWANMPVKVRSKNLMRAADAIEARAEELACLMALETGKAMRTECRPEVTMFVETLRFYAGLGYEIKGETVPFSPKMLTMTLREPVGVVGAILPWNVPLLLMALKVGPALMCGNSVVVKSAEQSPLTTLYAGKLIGGVLPVGTFNVISGAADTGRALVNHPKINKVTFTGSGEVGREVYQNAAKRLVPVTLELGGKSPMIVNKDVDLDKVVDGAITSMRFTRQGQSCSAGSRIFVHREVYQAFVDKLKDKVSELKMGDPFDEETDIGAVISKEQLEKIKSYIALGERTAVMHRCSTLPQDEGLKNGYYVQPVIFTEIMNTDPVARNEIFGPVACVIPWDDEDTVIAMANDTEYGLAGTIWTNDFRFAMRVVHELDAGFVQVNQNVVVQPGLSYGGVKSSGLGREASLESMLEHFTHKKTVIMNIRD